MNSFFYPKLAAGNLKKNKRTYFPYLLTCIVSIVMFYSLISISNNPGIDQLPGAESLNVILGLGTVVIGIFATILLFYTNSFLIKQRKKELGLYSILGMEKKHIAKTLFFEIVYLAIASLLLGLILGVLLSWLLFALLMELLNFSIPFSFIISPSAVITTVVLFGVIFLLTLLSDFWQIKLSNPIQLLHSSRQGEKEPKTKWILTILGIISLGFGYGIALTVKDPLSALMLFFLAVIFVIFGTYALFTAGSIAALKLLRKNKRFYYRSQNFISVSGMIYRMKQNAVGLANICILSTMVLVVVSTTVSLYLGQEDILQARFPTEISVLSSNEAQNRDQIQKWVDQAKDQTGVKATRTYSYSYMGFSCYRPDGTEFLSEATQIDTVPGHYCTVMMLTLEDYNKMHKNYELLEESEALIYSSGPNYGEKSLTIGGKEFQIRKELSESLLAKKQKQVIMPEYYLIVKDQSTIRQVYESFYQEEFPGLTYCYSFDFDGTSQQKQQFAENLSALTKGAENLQVQSREQMRQQWYSVYGGFLFLGIFLGLMFMMATVLIIYYKQISEGYDDRERFEIMQKVGMSDKEVKKTIQKQILMVFFLPLVGAVVHIAVAFSVISQLLLLFSLSNTLLFLACTLATVLIFALIYTLVYFVTARTYYRLVER